MAMMGPQATGGFQAPEPYVPESAKAAGALYEAGVDFDPVAYRNQFKPDSGGLASVAQPTPIEPVNLTGAGSSVQPKGYETGGPTVEFLPQRGGPASRGQHTDRVVSLQQDNTKQMPSFYQQPMGMMPQSFNPMGYGPMGMGMGMNRFMNPYGGGLGGMAYNFMNRPMPLYGQGGQFTAGQYQAPKPTTSTQPSFGFSPYGGFGYF